MDALLQLWHNLSNLEGLIRWGGYVVLTAIIFAETGLLVGFFLPGDSLLVTAGLLASQGFLNVYVMGAILSIAAVVGDSVGYAIGRATGPRIFTRENSFFFNKKHLQRAHAFYDKHGGKTIVIARFMPIIRTFGPVVAGVGQMRYRDFIAFNVAGGLAWVWSMLFLGHSLGRSVPGIRKHIDLVILAVVFLSFLPGVIGWLRQRSAAGVAPDSTAP
ncbi:MAG TPA: VTT domain-containing protein [Gemmatimonadaceae bacterium]|jgi:membrane-associated protein